MYFSCVFFIILFSNLSEIQFSHKSYFKFSRISRQSNDSDKNGGMFRFSIPRKKAVGGIHFLNSHELDQSEDRIDFRDTLHVVATVKNNTSRYASRVPEHRRRRTSRLKSLGERFWPIRNEHTKITWNRNHASKMPQKNVSSDWPDDPKFVS